MDPRGSSGWRWAGPTAGWLAGAADGAPAGVVLGGCPLIWVGAGIGPGPTGIARVSAGRPVGMAAALRVPAVAPAAAPDVANRTVVRRSEVPGGITASVQRRSAGPPRAGSGRAPVNASSARVLTRRGIASCVTVTFTSGATRGRARTSSTMAAPLTTPRTRPRARKLNSLAVTLSASRGARSPVIAIPCPASVAAGFGRVNSNAGSAMARRASPPPRSAARPRACRPKGVDGRFRPSAIRRSSVCAQDLIDREGTPAW
jgi:hypothetical protein